MDASPVINCTGVGFAGGFKILDGDIGGIGHGTAVVEEVVLCI